MHIPDDQGGGFYLRPVTSTLSCSNQGRNDMTSASGFWDRVADRYSRKAVPDEAVYQEKLRLTREQLRPDMAVLELGCGTGTTAISHARHVRHVHAIDTSQRMIEIAKARASAAECSNVTFERADIDEILVGGASYDAVLALSVLHLLDDWEESIRKVSRLLKPGGLFVSSTPCLAGGYRLLKAIAPLGHKLGLMPKVQFISPAALIAAIQGAGFVVERDWRPKNGRTVFAMCRRKSG
jgi:2-polyprenyl-3-methyl-5-hydroxy-6-metoxy-1,4-benzoquinol methylase